MHTFPPQELLQHQRGLRNLILRNQADVQQVSTQTGKPALQLPFILIQVYLLPNRLPYGLWKDLWDVARGS